MKSLKPSMRENKRYLLIRGQNLTNNVEKAVLDFIGIFGMSKTGLKFIKSNQNSAIIAVNREMLDSVRACLCVFPEKISVERVSGTLRGIGQK